MTSIWMDRLYSCPKINFISKLERRISNLFLSFIFSFLSPFSERRNQSIEFFVQRQSSHWFVTCLELQFVNYSSDFSFFFLFLLVSFVRPIIPSFVHTPTFSRYYTRQKLLTMLPTEEERSRIQEAQAANPDLPLGSAEQFLLTLASISELPARLKLWAFKLDFENSEKVSWNHVFISFRHF